MNSDLFDCPICLLKYNQKDHIPKILSSCGHTLCSSCLDQMLKTDSLTCPLDRKIFDHPIKRAHELPTNLFVLQLLDEVPKISSNLCNLHKESQNFVLLPEKRVVCQKCIPGNIELDNSIIISIQELKKEIVKKKKGLENQLRDFGTVLQTVTILFEEQKKLLKKQVKESFSKLSDLLSKKEQKIQLEIDGFFAHEETKFQDKVDEDLALKKEILRKITLFENLEISQEHIETFLENESNGFLTKNESKLLEELTHNLNEKVTKAVEELEKSITFAIKGFKPIPQVGKFSKLTAINSPNVFFYQNKLQSKPNNLYLKEIHEKWWGDLELIEAKYNLYMPWLFPNFYSSRINPIAKPLQDHEVEIFRNDMEIAKRLIKSYELILDFYGAKIIDYSTGEIGRKSNWETRYNEALLPSIHNQSGIRRLLTHLNIVGLRSYAIQLVNSLERAIYGEVGAYQKFLEMNKDFNNEAFEQAPLKKLSRSMIFELIEVYGDHKDDPEKIKLLEKNCNTKYPEGFEDSVYIKFFKDGTKK